MEENSKLDRDFKVYHQENPRVFELLRFYCAEVYRNGHRHYSIDAIMHRVRWHIDIETKDSDGYKMNNNYTSRYARLLMSTFEQLEGFFRIRKLKG